MKHKENYLKLKQHAKNMENKLNKQNNKISHLLAYG